MNLLALAALLAAAAPRSQEETRAVWVTRFEYSSEADVRAILRNCAALGFNVVLFQVRGQADAYYRSSLEPWAERLGGGDPGFDPLEVACREARRLGIALHAWVNVMPVWRGRVPPRDRSHLFYRRPEWIVAGRDGRRQALNDHYVCLNPCLPEVRRHLAAVARDIVERYPVDGLHLDYIRFIEGDWSYDARTLALFGGRPEARPAAWEAFRRGAVTEAVREIGEAVRQARPETTLSAAVFPTAEARRRVFQDAEGWVRAGLVDCVFPMIYEDDDDAFRRAVAEGDVLFRRGGRSVSIPGVGAYRHRRAEQTLRQIGMCRGGFAVFSYSSFYVSPDETRREDERLCRARREALRRFLEPLR
jgi:uncharacterized lipoprotein YddW (UPF0748 family)